MTSTVLLFPPLRKNPVRKPAQGIFFYKKDEKTMNTMQMKMNHHICEIRFLDSNSAETKIFDIYTPLNIDCNMLHRQMENKDDYLRKKRAEVCDETEYTPEQLVCELCKEQNYPWQHRDELPSYITTNANKITGEPVIMQLSCK